MKEIIDQYSPILEGTNVKEVKEKVKKELSKAKSLGLFKGDLEKAFKYYGIESEQEKLETLKKYVLMGRQVYKNLSLTVVNNETKKICENLDYKISNISSQLNNSHSLMTNLEANINLNIPC